MVSGNIVMKIHEQYLTETNEQLLKRHKERTGEPVYIGIIQKNMDEVLPIINNVGNSGNKVQDLLEIATHILGVITLKQPFMDGNRRTGIKTNVKKDQEPNVHIESRNHRTAVFLYFRKDERT